MPIKTYFAGQPIPENEKYAYIVAKDGYYVLKKNNVFESCTKIDAIPDLSEQEETFDLKAKKIPYSLIKEVLAFFYEVFKQYKSEAMVLLCYSEDNWSLVVPDQEVAGASVKYSNNHKHVVGSIHSHPGFGAFASGTDERDDEVIQKHRPPRDESQVWIQAASYVRVGGAGQWIHAGHAPVTRRGQHHGDHRDQNRGDDMAVGKLLCDAEQRHRSDGHDYHDPVEDQVPQRKNPL